MSFFFKKNHGGSRKRMAYPGGLGPWYVALLLKKSARNKTRASAISHTSPQYAIDIMNKNTAKGKYNWVIVSKIGPFEEWSQCVAFRDELNATRSQDCHLEKTRKMVQQHKPHLTLWTAERHNDTMETLVDRVCAQPIKRRARKNAQLNAARLSMAAARDVFSMVGSETATIGLIKRVCLCFVSRQRRLHLGPFVLH